MNFITFHSYIRKEKNKKLENKQELKGSAKYSSQESKMSMREDKLMKHKQMHNVVNQRSQKLVPEKTNKINILWQGQSRKKKGKGAHRDHS